MKFRHTTCWIYGRSSMFKISAKSVNKHEIYSILYFWKMSSAFSTSSRVKKTGQVGFRWVVVLIAIGNRREYRFWDTASRIALSAKVYKNPFRQKTINTKLFWGSWIKKIEKFYFPKIFQKIDSDHFWTPEMTFCMSQKMTFFLGTCNPTRFPCCGQMWQEDNMCTYYMRLLQVILQ